MDLSIIIVNWNSASYLSSCLESVEAQLSGLLYEAIIVDNGSREEEIKLLKTELEPRFSWAKFIYSGLNQGFAKANNQGFQHVRGEYVLLLNPDTRLTDMNIAGLTSACSQKEVGMVACKILNEDLTTQISCFYFPMLWRVFLTALLVHKVLPRLASKLVYTAPDLENITSADWVLGAFMLLRREVYAQVGGLDETIFMYGEDMDLCYRIRQHGYDIVYLPVFPVIHYGGGSGSQVWSRAHRESLIYLANFHFYRKHLGALRLVLVRCIYAGGASLKILLYAMGSLRPGKRRRSLNELKTQWTVLLTQLRGK